MTSDSYVGGQVYLDGGHLKQNRKEHNENFKLRKDISAYFNFVGPMVDLLTGFIFSTKIDRTNVPEDLKFIVEKATHKKSMSAFMRTVGVRSALHTVGILVDSPSFNREDVQTKADENLANLDPYCVLYSPFQIRDYSINKKDGKLNWVLLDESSNDDDDPMRPRSERKRYVLWTREYFQEITFKSTDPSIVKRVVNSVTGGDEWEVILGEEVAHPIGEVPFRFVSWRDSDEDEITESIFEDIALISRIIFNVMSYMIEMLGAGTFKVLFYPSKGGKLPDDIVNANFWESPAIPYDINSTTQPDFKGAELNEIKPFVEAIYMYIKYMSNRIGMNDEREKELHQSGRSITKEFEKVEAFLRQASEQLQGAERWIYSMASKWRKGSVESNETNVVYPTDYQSDDIDLELERLMNAFAMPFPKWQKLAVKGIASRTFRDAEEDEIKEAVKEAESMIQSKADAEDDSNNDNPNLTPGDVAA